jgi:DHA1 family tetracycline resistance protein-like MFS transporter
LIPLLLVVVIDLIGFGIIIPLLPFYAETFGASPQKVTMLMVVFSLSQFVAAPIWGGLSDKYGRRLIIWVTLAGSILAYILLAYSNTLYGLFIARAFAGFMAGNISTAQAYLTDITTKENRAKVMGFFGAAFGIGFILGPAIGGILAGSDPKNPNTFLPPIFAATLSTVALVLALLLLKDTRASIKPSKNKRIVSLIEALKVANLSKLILISFIVTVVFASMESTFSLWSERTYNWGPKQNGYIFAFAGLCGVIVQGFLISKLVNRFGESFLCRLGMLMISLGMISVALSYMQIHAYLSMALIAFGLGLFMPTISTLIVNIVSEDRRGWVLGVTQSSSSLARIIGPAFAGVFFELLGKNSPYIIGGLLLLLIVILFNSSIKKASQ